MNMSRSLSVVTSHHEHELRLLSICALICENDGYIAGAACDVCSKTTPGSWHCSKCGFDLCGSCAIQEQPPTAISNQFHPSHMLQFKNCIELAADHADYASGWLSCDLCKEYIRCSFHCRECCFDLCVHCALRDTHPFLAETDDSEGFDNISHNKQAKCSSIEDSSRGPNYAVDGRNHTRWASASSDPQWLDIDLGVVCPLSHVNILWEAAFGAKYDIEVSSNRVNWTVVASVDGNRVAGWVKSRFPAGTRGAFVRMHGFKRGTNYGYSIYHFNVYGENVGVGLKDVVVTSDNVSVGARVVRGPHWPTSAFFDGIRGYPGTVISIHSNSKDGSESAESFDGPIGCCLVKWDLILDSKPHRIGWQGKYELCFLQGTAPAGYPSGLPPESCNGDSSSFSQLLPHLTDSNYTTGTVASNGGRDSAGEYEERRTLETELWHKPRWERAEWKSRLDALNGISIPVTPLHAEQVHRVLQGRHTGDDIAVKLKVVSVFISSTFTDTFVERNLLIADVYPYLKRFASRLGIEFSASEMRWGIREEASSAHQTYNICMAELERCQRESLGLDYILLLGNKYGYRPFPADIPVKEFGLLCNAVADIDPDSAVLIREWFVMDTNVEPPKMTLLPSTNAEGGNWWSIFERIQNAFRSVRHVVPDPARRYLYNVSVTECEAMHGMLARVVPCGEDRRETYYYRRVITNMDDFVGDMKANMFVDRTGPGAVDFEAQQLLCDLRDVRIVEAQTGNSMQDYSIEYAAGNGIDVSFHSEYLKNFSDHFCNLLCESIVHAAARCCVDPDDVFEEVRNQALFGRDRCASFVGREEIVSQVKDYVYFTESSQSDAAKVTGVDKASLLVLYGPGGAGKSATMAQCITEMQKALPRGTGKAAVSAIAVARQLSPETVFVVRFLGTTPHSSSIQVLLRSLCLQISRNYNRSIDNVPKAYKELVGCFSSLLGYATADKPLVIFLDSLDQLSQQDNAHSLGWLPTTLPPHCRIVVSALAAPDEQGYALLKLQSTVTETNLIEMKPMTQENGDAILSCWLYKSNRNLTVDQKGAVLTAFSQCPLPLYLNIMYQISLNWCSYTVVDNVFPPSVPELLRYLFSRMCHVHGRLLVHHALGYLTLAKRGLSRAELEDILSLDDEVLNDVYEWWVPPIRRIPGLVVTRLLSDIEMYLVTQGVDGGVPVLSWYHREFKLAAYDIFLSEETQRVKLCQMIAAYFSSEWSSNPKPFVDRHGVCGSAQRKVSPQDLLLSAVAQDDHPATNGEVKRGNVTQVFNQRRVSELPNALILSKQWNLVEKTLSDVHFLQASVSLGVAPITLSEVNSAMISMLQNSIPVSPVLYDVSSFLSREMYTLQKSPKMFYQLAVNYTRDSHVSVSARSILSSPKTGWLKKIGSVDETALVTRFMVGTCDTSHVSFSPLHSNLVAGISGESVVVGDIYTHTEVSFQYDYSLSGVTWTIDGENLVLAASKGHLLLVSARIGVLKKVISASSSLKKQRITGIGTISESTVVTGHQGGLLGVWNIMSGEVTTINLTAEGDTFVAVTLDSKYMACVTESGKCSVWTCDKFQQIRSFVCPEGMLCVCISADGSLVAVNRGNDGTFGWNGDGAVVYSEGFSNPKFLPMVETDISGQAVGTKGLSFHPNNQHILYVLNSSNQIYVFDVMAERVLSKFFLPGNCHCVRGGLAMARSGEYIASVGTGNNIIVWNPAAQVEAEVPSGEVGAVSLTYEGKAVAICHSCVDHIRVCLSSFPSKVLFTFKNTATLSTACARIVTSRRWHRMASTTHRAEVSLIQMPVLDDNKLDAFNLSQQQLEIVDDEKHADSLTAEVRFLDNIFGRECLDVAVSPCGEFIAVCGLDDQHRMDKGGVLKYMSFATGEILWELKGASNRGNVRGGGILLQMSRTGDKIAFFDIENRLNVYDTTDHRKLHHFALKHVSCFRLSQDFNTLIYADDYEEKGVPYGNKVIHVCRLDAEEPVLTFLAHTGNITGLCLLEEENVIASCSEDGCLRLSNMDTGDAVCEFYTPGRQGILSMDVMLSCPAAGGSARLAVGDSVGRVFIFDFIV